MTTLNNLYKICGAIIIASWAATLMLTCAGSCGQTNIAGHAIVDCTKLDERRVADVFAEFVPLVVGEAPDWAAIEANAIAAGREIGGCALAEFVRAFAAGTATNAAPTRLPTSDAARTAHGVMEDFRGRFAGGATFHTAKGDV